MSGSVESAGCRFLFGKRVVRVCLRTRYYTNSCVHCYGYIIFWRRMQSWMFLRVREVDGARRQRKVASAWGAVRDTFEVL